MLTTILETLRKTRIKKKLSQENLADYLNITQSSYGKIEKGKTHLTIENLLKICNCLEINPADLFTTPTMTQKQNSLIEQQVSEALNKVFQEHTKDLAEIRNLLFDINKKPVNY